MGSADARGMDGWVVILIFTRPIRTKLREDLFHPPSMNQILAFVVEMTGTSIHPASEVDAAPLSQGQNVVIFIETLQLLSYLILDLRVRSWGWRIPPLTESVSYDHPHTGEDEMFLCGWLVWLFWVDQVHGILHPDDSFTF